MNSIAIFYETFVTFINILVSLAFISIRENCWFPTIIIDKVYEYHLGNFGSLFSLRDRDFFLYEE